MTKAVAKTEPRSLFNDMSKEYGMERAAFESTMRKTIMQGKDVSNEQMAAFLVVANKYKLNPFTKEIFAFPSRGGIQPVVSIDGWLRIINDNPDCDGFDLIETFDDNGQIYSVTCKMYRKSRSRPVELTEYYSECVRDTEQWKGKPVRMMHHKALIQAARYAFGYSGIVDEDEAATIKEMGEADVIRPQQATAAKQEAIKERLKDAAAEPIEVIEAGEAANDDATDS